MITKVNELNGQHKLKTENKIIYNYNNFKLLNEASPAFIFTEQKET